MRALLLDIECHRFALITVLPSTTVSMQDLQMTTSGGVVPGGGGGNGLPSDNFLAVIKFIIVNVK